MVLILLTSLSNTRLRESDGIKVYHEILNRENTILQIFPVKRRDFWKKTATYYEKIQEIRIRVNMPILLLGNGMEWQVTKEGKIRKDKTESIALGTQSEILEILQFLCKDSIYAYADEIGQGFITTLGGNRIGIVGEIVIGNNGKVSTIKNFSGLNIRISHQIIGVADVALPYLYQDEKLCNTLIISPPGCGKTTLLRDLIRQISSGTRWARGMQVGVVDERSELGNCHKGIPQNDLGTRTDILDGCPKAQGMIMLLRAMGPEVIAVDELGDKEDLKATKAALQGGCVILATIHGNSIEDLRYKEGMESMIEDRVWERFIILGKKNGKCKVLQILDGKEQIRYISDPH